MDIRQKHFNLYAKERSSYSAINHIKFNGLKIAVFWRRGKGGNVNPAGYTLVIQCLFFAPFRIAGVVDGKGDGEGGSVPRGILVKRPGFQRNGTPVRLADGTADT
jgi:hypothetical protein